MSTWNKRLLLLILAALPVFAQTDRGTVTGEVSDTSMGVVAGADMQLKETETGFLYRTVSSGTGVYTFTQIPLGTYEMTVTAAGFKKFVRTNIAVEASQTLGVNVLLEVGAATESITISAEASLLKTESGEQSVNITTESMSELGILPIGAGNSSQLGIRNPMAVTELTPGTFYNPSVDLRVNGSPSNTMSVRVEGLDSIIIAANPKDYAQSQPGVDSIQEVSVVTSNYAAEYGQAGAGQFNYTIKSGTNSLHGALFNYFDNAFLNASQAYTHLTPANTQNNFGGSVGGPVWIPKVYKGKNKTFFFFSYEGFIQRSTFTTQYPTVPTMAYRNGDFRTALSGKTITATGGQNKDSAGTAAVDGMIFDPRSIVNGPDGVRVATPFANNTIPPSLLPSPTSTVGKILSFIPQPNVGGPNQLINNYNNPFQGERVTYIPALKIDHTISSKAKVSFYWSNNISNQQYGITVQNSTGIQGPIDPSFGPFINSQTERLNFDYTVSPTTLFHLSAGYIANNFRNQSPTTDFSTSSIGLTGATVATGQFPAIAAMTNPNNTGGMVAMGAGFNRTDAEKPSLALSLTKVSGSHTLKFGVEGHTEGYVTISLTNTAGGMTFANAQTADPWFSDKGIALANGSTGFAFASFLLGAANSETLAAPIDSRLGRHFAAAFAQDAWKVSRKLSVDYGLRWDYGTYPKEQYGRTPDFSATTPNPVAAGHLGATIFEATCNCSFAKNYPLAFGPRFGMAYQIDDKTVFRGGVGVVYSSPLAQLGVGGAAGNTLTTTAPQADTAAMTLNTGVASPAYSLAPGYNLNPKFPNLSAGLYPTAGTFTGSPAVIDQNAGRPARQVQWSIGFQRELLPGLFGEANYVGNRGVWWQTSALNYYNFNSPQQLLSNYGLNITSPAAQTILAAQVGSAAAGPFRNQLPFAGFPTTFSVARSLTPYPQFGAMSSAGPLGNTWYDSLQTKLSKRTSHGLNVNYIFTWSKQQTLGVEGAGAASTVNNIFDRASNKQLSSFDQPLVSVLSLTYTVPKFGINKYLQLALRDWTVGTLLQYASGQPIAAPATATSNLAQTLLVATHAQRVPGQPLFLKDLNCHCFDPSQTQVLNPAAWTDPAPGQFANSADYFGDYRYARRPRESLNFGRNIRIRERMTFQIRMSFTNPFNRTQIPNPTAANYVASVTQTTAPNGNKVNAGGFGAIATNPANSISGERVGTLSARLTF